ncbi:MAG: MBL fold metallo-hydrolase [Chloroflexi bacterium]|nr:MBL fold metallo-hydrolase [Chloroflexota bacterium]
MDFELFLTHDLGDNSYLLASEGEAALIDPQRDVWRFLPTAEQRKANVRYVFETHVHNDYVSGAQEMRAINGAQIVAPAKGEYEFEYEPAEEGREYRLGTLRIVAMDTPGHTPEHVSWLVYEGDADTPAALFSGGSLLVGSAGRTDLLGMEHADELTRSQFRTMRRLAELPDALAVLPTHGAGSFCASAAPSMKRTTTIGEERLRNPALSETDEAEFVRRQLSGLMDYPAYYASMAPINRRGADVLGAVPEVPALTPDDVDHLAGEETWIVDARDRFAFARSHIPGSINVEMTSSFSTYVGWVLPFNARIALVLPEGGERKVLHDALTQLLRIGFDRVEGYLDGGANAWETSGRTLASYPIFDIDGLCEVCMTGDQPHVLDVRQSGEFEAGHIPESQHIFVGDLRERVSEVPNDRTIWITCAGGFRAAIAASIVAREGRDVRFMASSGIPEWLSRCFPAETGPG